MEVGLTRAAVFRLRALPSQEEDEQNHVEHDALLRLVGEGSSRNKSRILVIEFFQGNLAYHTFRLESCNDYKPNNDPTS